jgi:PAS domain S-box-containing protein
MGFLAAIGLIAWLAFASYNQNQKFKDTSEWIAHTNRVLFHTEQVLSLTIDLEAGQRGYSLTGRDEFLEPTRTASAAIEDHINRLAELTSDNTSQQIRIRKLKEVVEHKLIFTQQVIEVRKQDFGKAQVMNASLKGKKMTDDIRQLIRDIQQEENMLLKSRSQLSNERIQGFYLTFSLLLVFVAAILCIVFYFIHISLKKRTQAEDALKAVSARIQDIYDNAPCGYHALDGEGKFIEINKTWLIWLQYSRDEVINKKKFSEFLSPQSLELFKTSFPRFKEQGKIQDLEFEMVRKDGSEFHVLLNAVAMYDETGKFLQSRSSAIDYTSQRKALNQIEQLNKELESFSYSVSHDLRAPLRSIDGYTQILIDDYGKQIDAEGNRLMKIVINNARRMAQLIDDLLDFSRVGRKEIAKTSISTENMVKSIISEIQSTEQSRQLEFSVNNLPASFGDASLLRQVWYNLISNAVKYTRKKEKAMISISGEHQGDSAVFHVTDNGTGFDMQYAPKLFGVFQRLHRQQDFEGTGVGLAIVHRIISRHGGKVWAEGKVNEGAVFSFSLPQT